MYTTTNFKQEVGFSNTTSCIGVIYSAPIKSGPGGHERVHTIEAARFKHRALFCVFERFLYSVLTDYDYNNVEAAKGGHLKYKERRNKVLQFLSSFSFKMI